MRQNDLLKSDTGDHLRVLLYGDQQSYVVNCQRCKMPFPISTPSLLQMENCRRICTVYSHSTRIFPSVSASSVTAALN